jgi:hypothetical protein
LPPIGDQANLEAEIARLRESDSAMSGEQSKATDHVREHVNRAHDAIIDFRRDGINTEGVLMKPVFQAAALTAAREELSKAIAIIESTNWLGTA